MILERFPYSLQQLLVVITWCDIKQLCEEILPQFNVPIPIEEQRDQVKESEEVDGYSL